MLKIVIIVILIAVLSGVIVIEVNKPDSSELGAVTKDQNNSESIDLGLSTENSAAKDARVSGIDAKSILDLSGQSLSKVPGYVFDRTDLQELNLANNNLEGALPAEIRHLQNLRVLNLSNNAFTGVPAEIGQLGKLEILNLSNNQLTGLPHELGNLSSLKILDLRGNNYSLQDLNTIKENLPVSVVIEVD